MARKKKNDEDRNPMTVWAARSSAKDPAFPEDKLLKSLTEDGLLMTCGLLRLLWSIDFSDHPARAGIFLKQFPDDLIEEDMSGAKAAASVGVYVRETIAREIDAIKDGKVPDDTILFIAHNDDPVALHTMMAKEINGVEHGFRRWLFYGGLFWLPAIHIPAFAPDWVPCGQAFLMPGHEDCCIERLAEISMEQTLYPVPGTEHKTVPEHLVEAAMANVAATQLLSQEIPDFLKELITQVDMNEMAKGGLIRNPFGDPDKETLH